jgi:Predicted membrane protein
MWIAYAFLSALFAGITSILAKIGIADTDSNLATALRTIVVVVFAWLMVLVVGSQSTIGELSERTVVFLILSGLATGGSWLYYFKALQIGDVNKVVPVDKSSTVLTMLLAFVLLGEGLSLLKFACMLLIAAGTYMMIEKKQTPGAVKRPKGNKWLLYAILSAVFASLTAILGKVGIEGVESNLGTAIRTLVVVIMAWLIVFWQGTQGQVKSIDRRSWLFLFLSGLATGLSWLCYYRALQEGLAGVVVPIDKLSILVTVLFGYLVFKEKLHGKSAAGLVLIVAGTLLLLKA